MPIFMMVTLPTGGRDISAPPAKHAGFMHGSIITEKDRN